MGKIFENLAKKSENILKKGSLMHVTIACMKQQEHVLPLEEKSFFLPHNFMKKVILSCLKMNLKITYYKLR